MSKYPGHYVCLIIPLTEEEEKNVPTTVKRGDKKHKKGVRFTRVQLLRPKESLVLGHAYRLITSQGSPLRSVSSVFPIVWFGVYDEFWWYLTEVMKVLREKKCAKTKKHHTEAMTTVKKLLEKNVPVDSFNWFVLEDMCLTELMGFVIFLAGEETGEAEFSFFLKV